MQWQIERYGEVWKTPYEVSRSWLYSARFGLVIAYASTFAALIAGAFDFSKVNQRGLAAGVDIRPDLLIFAGVGVLFIVYMHRLGRAGIYVSRDGVLVRTWWRDCIVDWHSLEAVELGRTLLPSYVPVVLYRRDRRPVVSFGVSLAVVTPKVLVSGEARNAVRESVTELRRERSAWNEPQ